MSIKTLRMIWRIASTLVILWVFSRFVVLLKPLSDYVKEMPVRANWVLDKLTDKYREEIDQNFARNLLVSHSIHSFSLKSDLFGINEKYAGEFTLVIMEDTAQKKIKCIWELSNNDENIKIVEWQEL